MIRSPTAPYIRCHDLSPPPPAPVAAVGPDPTYIPNPTGLETRPTYVPPDHVTPTVGRLPPSPPPLKSPPPSPPRVLASDCTSGGLAEVQRHVRATAEGEHETLRVVVSPSQWWPTGYQYVIGIRGLELNVWRTVRGRLSKLRRTHRRPG